MKTLIQEAIDEALEGRGFRRSGTTWRREEDESILIVNLQRSAWGDMYYVNLAVWLKALGPPKTPKEHVCHVRTRLGGAKLERALNCEDRSISDRERRSTIIRAVNSRGAPFLEKCASISSLKAMFDLGKLNNALVNGRVEALLQRVRKSAKLRDQ